MEIETKMEYAIDLADGEFVHEFEDIFKLAGLCDEVAKLRSAEALIDPEIEMEFIQKIKHFYDKSGRFRSEIERLPVAKQFIEILNVGEIKHASNGNKST